MDASAESGVFFAITAGAPEETHALAARLARTLPSPVALLLVGPLGTGKTVFAQGMAHGLGIGEQLTSPSFLLMKEYRGSRPLRHLDLFRLRRPEEVRSLGLTDDLPDDAVVVVEWADRFKLELAMPTLEIRFRMGDGETERRLEFSARGLATEETRRMADALRSP